MDFDDACDDNDGLRGLMRLKLRDPGFRVTLFAIPTRLSDKLLKQYSDLEWIELAVHGWRHSRHECLGWTAEETKDKMERALSIYPGFARVFKAPNWELDLEVYKGVRSSGFAIADHIRNIEVRPPDIKHYTYNERLRGDSLTRLHGHVQAYNGTGLTEAFEKWEAPSVGSTYKFVSEVVQARPRLGN